MKAEARAKQLLKAAGMIVYDPGQAIGECKAPYVVIHSYGNYQTIQSTRLTYTLLLIHCYVPISSDPTATLGTLVDQARTVMLGMHTQAKDTGREEPDTIASDYKALSRTIEYQVLKARKG